ncbi:Eco57I restriction-modification methylase domain-containing protein [soil metagenome]
MQEIEQLQLLSTPSGYPPEPGIQYGEVFTRRWVVDLILDLVGYEPESDLSGRVIVEPSCGAGAFLLPIVERLIGSAQRHGRDLSSLGPAIRAYDLSEANAQVARKSVALMLEDAGAGEATASQLVSEWISTGDFLLSDLDTGGSDYVVGNPPYIRLEGVSPATMQEYRRRYPTMRGRSDIYVGFIERALTLLRRGGMLSFICADRWMRNQYGAKLRDFVSSEYAVDAVITMHEVNAFEDEVSAYPAVVVFRNGPVGTSVVAEARREFGPEESSRLSTWVAGTERSGLQLPTVVAARVEGWPKGPDLWPAASPQRLKIIADLERGFPPLEDSRTGTRVGIGLATGCDEVYLTTDRGLVEPDRLLPMLKAADLASGKREWSGTYLVNPWEDRRLVDLEEFAQLAHYFESSQAKLRARHIARRRPNTWYRTIDRVDPQLADRPKLLLPDLKAAAHPVLDSGGFYPHHNLYFVVSDAWDLEVLGGLLLSDVANLFVGTYCVKMRGGCYRFQAQYLRRIRVPDPESLTRLQREGLASAFRARNVEEATRIALQIYGLDGLPSKIGPW